VGIRPPLNNDVVGFPIEPSQVPTEQSPGLFDFIGVQAYYLPGAETTRNGNDRFTEDIRGATAVWGFPIVPNSAPITLTEPT
jgi:hypothetical protein